jgi:hypothetical protein
LLTVIHGRTVVGLLLGLVTGACTVSTFYFAFISKSGSTTTELSTAAPT